MVSEEQAKNVDQILKNAHALKQQWSDARNPTSIDEHSLDALYKAGYWAGYSDGAEDVSKTVGAFDNVLAIDYVKWDT